MCFWVPMDIFEYMDLEWGVFVDTMIIEMSGHSGIILCLNVIKMMTKSFDYGIFGLTYIDAWHITNIAGNCVNQITTLAIGSGDSSICTTFVGICNCPSVAYSGAIPAGFLSVARFL